MILLKFNERIHIFLTGALALMIPVYPNILPPIIILLTINWLLVPKLIPPGLKNVLKNLSLILMISFYLLYLIGMVYSNNKKVGLETLETKLSFLILPMVFSSYAETVKRNIDRYLRLFIYGNILIALICFAWAAYRFYKPVLVLQYGVPYDLGASYFYYNELSVFLHPSYISMYSVFALISIFYLFKTDELKLSLKWVAAIVLLVVFILLLSSKAGWIGLFLIGVYFFRWLMFKKRIVHGLIIIGLLIGLFAFFNIYFTPRFFTRIPKLSVITETIKGITEENKVTIASADGTQSRLLVWKAATEIIKEHFFAGVGTGDAKDKMLEKYREKGMISEYESKLNSHNQYLNTFIALGVFGFAILFLCFFIPVYFSIKRKSVLLTSFSIITCINFLFESMLETQAGVVFYAFFYTLLCVVFLLPEESENINVVNNRS